MMINSIIMFSDVQLKRQILTCFTALGKLSTVTLCLTDMPPLGRCRLQNSGEYRFLSVLYSLWLDCPKIMLLLFLFKAEASLKLNARRTYSTTQNNLFYSTWFVESNETCKNWNGLGFSLLTL